MSAWQTESKPLVGSTRELRNAILRRFEAIDFLDPLEDFSEGDLEISQEAVGNIIHPPMYGGPTRAQVCLLDHSGLDHVDALLLYVELDEPTIASVLVVDRVELFVM